WYSGTYDHRVWRTGLPVRSAVLKPHAASSPSMYNHSMATLTTERGRSSYQLSLTWGMKETFFVFRSDLISLDSNGDAPLHMSARCDFPNRVRLLRLDSQADFNTRNNKGNTPLHEAVDLEIVITVMETIIELRKAGTDIHLVNNDGQAVWDLSPKGSKDPDF
ncbi:hypothetical protein N7466_002868, partial [Penicillium verhagenii]|uniref:uncharacterized protein n=1 Tax=Penicillium verhagenii TaxID=1562060 RepID=UPI002544EB03